MITSITIKGFQNHVESKLDFDPGVNIIAGPSDSGKSAVIRAINWAINNKPSGDGHVRRGGGDVCSVRLDFSDGDDFIRFRSKKENSYIKNGKVFKALRTDVPNEISEVHKFGPYNISSQLLICTHLVKR